MLSHFNLFKTQMRHYNSEKTLHDHYATLNVPSTASKDEIHRAFLNEAKKVHPDMLVKVEDELQRRLAADRFKRLNDAYEVLGDAVKRRQYDAQIGLSTRPMTSTSVSKNRYKNFAKKKKSPWFWVNVIVIAVVLGLPTIWDLNTLPVDEKDWKEGDYKKS